jgi:hypothetical protein
MGYTIFRTSNFKAAWGPESRGGGLFRDKNANATKDETNAVDATFYYLPIDIGRSELTITRMTKEVKKGFGDGSSRCSSVMQGAVKPIKISIRGPVLNNSLDFHYYDGITTTGANPYTHVFTNTTQTKVAPPDSIELLIKIPNTGTSADTIMLFVGTMVMDKIEDSAKGGEIWCTYEFESAREIAGTNLTTWPTKYAKRIFLFGDVHLTLNYGGTALKVSMESYTYHTKYIGRKLVKGDGDIYMEEPVPEETVEYILMTKLRLKEDIIAKLKLDPLVANDIDAGIKYYRNITTDYMNRVFTNCYMELVENGFDDGMWKYDIMIYPNPEEAASTFVRTEINALDKARYQNAA